MDNIYFYSKKSKKCLINNCDGELKFVQLKTKIIKGNATKDICLGFKQCDKCGCYYMTIYSYSTFKQCECTSDFKIINSNEQIIELSAELKKKSKQRKSKGHKKRKYTLEKENRITTIKKRAGRQGYCIKCGAQEYREGIGYCWECYKDQRTGY